jgi:hypothetical protein
MAFRIQIRRDDSTRWTVNNPILLEGELGYETDTKYMKIGDGTTPWNLLNYWSGGLPSNINVFEDGVLVATGATGLNFTGRSGSVTSNGKYVNIDIGGNIASYFSVTATLSGGNFASFSASQGPDGQPLTGPNWNYTLTNSGNNLTITHNEGTKPLSLATHGRDTTDIFVTYPFGTSNSGFALSYPTIMNSFTVYGVNSSNTGASASGTVEIVWVFGATV